MDDKDPPPFGYTFSPDFFGAASTDLDNAGPSLLSDMENQHLTDFFSTGWTDPPTFMPPPEHKDTTDDFSGWGLNIPPATIHSVSTTIPDQSQLHHGFHNDHSFAMPQTNHNTMYNTQDDLQAASTLFHNAQMPQPNGRSNSFHGLLSSSNTMPTSAVHGHPSGTFDSLPLVQTQNGLINEQLAALLPNHGANGTIDARLASEYAANSARERHEAELREFGMTRPPLKRTYTYGTDSSFNGTGFQVSKKEETEEHVTSRLIRELHHAQPLARPATNGAKLRSPTGHIHFPGSLVDMPSDEEEQSEDASEDDDDSDKPRKRRKTKAAVKIGKSKSVSAASGKNRKASTDERGGKKKRGSVAKVQRENLSEEQKRNNHILSEQKRRNIIKRGFEDLHDLVPEIRNGGLSKSGVLVEAANFLDDLADYNKEILDILGGDDG